VTRRASPRSVRSESEVGGTGTAWRSFWIKSRIGRPGGRPRLKGESSRFRAVTSWDGLAGSALWCCTRWVADSEEAAGRAGAGLSGRSVTPRSDGIRVAGDATTQRSLAGVSGQPGGLAALASGTGSPSGDLPCHQPWSSGLPEAAVVLVVRLATEDLQWVGFASSARRASSG
jgi:hypothetical protein